MADDFITMTIGKQKNIALTERDVVLKQLLPHRVYIDYFHEINGINYTDTDYDKLFIEIRKRNYRKPIYSLVVGLLRIMAVFVGSASFIKKYPLKLDK